MGTLFAVTVQAARSKRRSKFHEESEMSQLPFAHYFLLTVKLGKSFHLVSTGTGHASVVLIGHVYAVPIDAKYRQYRISRL